MSAITITFGDCAENHVGMQKIGEAADEGFTYENLLHAYRTYEAAGFQCELIDLISEGEVEELEPEPAFLLIVRNAITSADALYAELNSLPVDKKALFRGVVKNKIARYNLCFADFAQDPNYELGMGRIVSFDTLPQLNAVRQLLPRSFGRKAENLYAEGNYYYDIKKCGIGFHGDTERKKVIALRLGDNIPLHYQWYHRHRPVGHRIAINLNHGDLYAMSEKAVGYDWRRSIIPTLRHAAGAAKYHASRDK